MKNAFFTLIVLMLIAPMAFCQTNGETLKIAWPEEYKWKIGSDQENNTEHVIQMIPEKETVENWTILASIMSYKSIKDAKIDAILDAMRKSSKQESAEAKLTVIEKNESSANPWVQFKVESPSFVNDPKPESQLYYIIQGNDALYITFIAIKDKALSDKFVSKWSKVFKGSELIKNNK